VAIPRVCSLEGQAMLCSLTFDESFRCPGCDTSLRPCSRCGEAVPASSLFCPQCGQSMVRPKPGTAYSRSCCCEPPIEESSVTPDEPDTLSKATGWLRRSLNLGKKSDIELELSASESLPLLPRRSPLKSMSLFDIEEAERVATAEASNPARPYSLRTQVFPRTPDHCGGDVRNYRGQTRE
jgi:hypothetical protein